MNKLSLKMKLTVGFGVLLAILLAMGIVSYTSVQKLRELSDLSDHRAQGRFLAASVNSIINNQKAEVRGYLLTGQEAEMTRFAENTRTLASLFDKLDTNLNTEKGRALGAHLRQTSDAYHQVIDQGLQLHRTDKTKEALALFADPKTDALRSDLGNTSQELVEFQDTLKRATREEQSAAEATTSTLTVTLTVIGLIVGLIVAALISSSVTRPITSMVGLIEQIAANNLAADDLSIASDDEIGKASAALNEMKTSLHGVIQSIAETAERVATASAELSATSQQISANSEETSAQANLVAQATQQVTRNLQGVSGGAGEMTSTIQSIASNTHEAASVAQNAVQTTQTANTTIAKLGDSSAEIGEVIKVITSIAQQTNLLALNATIEAARAGESGKGFAVVANEVKELAKQTAEATEDISRKITAIQSDTKDAVSAIGTITEVIQKISNISGTIATAVEEQSATTSEMTRNLSDAAKGSGEIASNIEGVATAAQGTSSSAQESQKAADDLARMATELRGLVAHFQLETAAHKTTVATPRPQRSRSAAAGR
jgi:methyl-accepting chemotaxis protein